MFVSAKFYKDVEIDQANQRAIVILAKHVEDFDSEPSAAFNRASFLTWLRLWGLVELSF